MTKSFLPLGSEQFPTLSLGMKLDSTPPLFSLKGAAEKDRQTPFPSFFFTAKELKTIGWGVALIPRPLLRDWIMAARVSLPFFPVS